MCVCTHTYLLVQFLTIEPQASLKLPILLPQPLKHWNYKVVSQCTAFLYCLCFFISVAFINSLFILLLILFYNLLIQPSFYVSQSCFYFSATMVTAIKFWWTCISVSLGYRIESRWMDQRMSNIKKLSVVQSNICFYRRTRNVRFSVAFYPNQHLILFHLCPFHESLVFW